MARIRFGVMTAKLLYSALCVIALITWATGANGNISLPVYGTALFGYAFAIAGLGLIIGAYRLSSWVPHPMYTGFVALTLGVSMIARSPAGLWLVTPAVALACFAWILGNEHMDGQQPLLPPDDERRPSTRDGIRFIPIVIIPWLALYEFTTHMGIRGTAFRFPFEDQISVYPWTAILYETSYLTVVFATTWTRTNRQLRQLIITSWVATAIVFPIYWLMPSAAPRRPMVDASWIGHLLYQERSSLQPTAAFPSFHVLWAIFVGRLWPRWLWLSYSAAIAVSCITTGMHYIPDILAALAIAPLLLEPERRIWRPLVRLTDRVASSRTQWRIGPLRVGSHGLYAAFAVFLLILLSDALRPGREYELLIAALAGLIGAGLWARSSIELGVYGFYAAVVAVALTCALFDDRWFLWGVCCLVAPWLQALRCLESSPASARLYFILANVFLGLVLLRLWTNGCPLALICGVYAIGTGLVRFVEAANRHDLARGFQWISVGMTCAGAIFTTLSSPYAIHALRHSWPPLWPAIAAALITGVAMGVEPTQPKSTPARHL